MDSEEDEEAKLVGDGPTAGRPRRSCLAAPERSGLDDADKGFHRGQPIHLHSLLE
jgi:hypothetical protein